MTKDTKPIEVETMPQQAMAVRENAKELVKQSTDVAGLCREIVLKTACQIQGKKYVKVEGWQSIATAHGCVAGCRDVEVVSGGVRCIGELKVISTGQIIASAEGFVGEDEPTWYGGDNGRGKVLPKRADYAIRAMCQTRAISRVCRFAFAHVVVLMDAGLSTCPAEEVPDGGFDNAPAAPPASRPASRQAHGEDSLDGEGGHPPQPAAKPTTARPAAPQSAGNGQWRDVRIGFGKNKGKQLGELKDASLMWYFRNCDLDKDTPLRHALDAGIKELYPDGLPDEEAF